MMIKFYVRLFLLIAIYLIAVVIYFSPNREIIGDILGIPSNTEIKKTENKATQPSDNYYNSNSFEDEHNSLSEGFKEESNASRIYKNSVSDHRDYVRGNDGKIYENKPCFNCSGEGYTIFINPATGQKETNICNACDGVWQIGY